MQLPIAAILALAAASSATAQSAPAIGDLNTATPLAGNWNYAPAADGSEATFADSAGNGQLWVHCTRATRRVSIAKRASAPAPVLNVWTSSLTRSVGSSFNPATGRLTIDLATYDPLLDAITMSRGRVGFGIGGEPPLVVPAWAEAARVIEDCRA
ncbi:MAG: hypothetical protein ACJ8FN_13490 [Sphingomicrobium sp.]